MHQENSKIEWSWVLDEFKLSNFVEIQDRYRKRRSLSKWEKKRKRKIFENSESFDGENLSQILLRFYNTGILARISKNVSQPLKNSCSTINSNAVEILNYEDLIIQNWLLYNFLANIFRRQKFIEEL